VWIGDEMPDCEILIKSFERFECLERLIRSIRWFYPHAKIIVADDSKTKPPKYLKNIKNVKWIELPYDVGLAEGRNQAVQASKSEYVILCDDDFVFTEETKIEKLLEILQHDTNVDVIGGAVRVDGEVAKHWSGHLRRDNDRILINALSSRWKVMGDAPYRRTDLALNFFAARKDRLIPWDSQWKIGYEHMDFFLTMKERGRKTYFTPSVILGNYRGTNDIYKEKRGRFRDKEVEKQFCEKWNIRERPICPQTSIGVEKRITLDDICMNIVVLGVGHSNTTITAKQLGTLGWNLGDADEEFAESVNIRALNNRILRAGILDEKAARKALKSFEQPWIIKDPRFAKGAFPYWLRYFEPYHPILLWITKDMKAVEQSYLKRDMSPKHINTWLKNCEEYYNNWPWYRLKIDASQIFDACGMLDLTYPH